MTTVVKNSRERSRKRQKKRNGKDIMHLESKEIEQKEIKGFWSFESE